MREIKFRGKRIADGEWVIGDLVTETDVDLIVKRMFIHLRLSPVDFVGDSLTSKLCLHEVDPETVGQYTGLKDLWKGDIISDNIGTGYIEYIPSKAAFRVNYGNGTCKWFIDYLDSELDSIEVIGNKHDEEKADILGR